MLSTVFISRVRAFGERLPLPFPVEEENDCFEVIRHGPLHPYTMKKLILGTAMDGI